MPVYTYQVINEDGSGGETFDVVRPMSEPPLTTHPETGQPVKRVYKPVNLGGKHSTKKLLSDSNLEKHGFTKYQKVGKGQYEKRTGQGPGTISAD